MQSDDDGGRWWVTPTEGRPVANDDRLDTSTPHTARIWNYILGGTDNFPADRAVGDLFSPDSRPSPRTPGTVGRSCNRWCAIWPARPAYASSSTSAPGCPRPTTPTRWPSAVAPDSRIVYVDNDPLVLAHARSLLTSRPDGATELRRGEPVRHRPGAARGRAHARLLEAGRGAVHGRPRPHRERRRRADRRREAARRGAVGQLLLHVRQHRRHPGGGRGRADLERVGGPAVPPALLPTGCGVSSTGWSSSSRDSCR